MASPEEPKVTEPEKVTPEAQYPYHPEAWQEICELSEAGLVTSEFGEDPGGTEQPFIYSRWRVNRLGFACRLERPFGERNEVTAYTLSFEDHVPGQRYFGKLPFIADGLRRPVARSPRNYGIVEYCQAQGLLKEPIGVLPERYIRSIGHVADMKDPEQRIIGFEGMLRELLKPAPRGWEEPIPPPDFNRHLN